MFNWVRAGLSEGNARALHDAWGWKVEDLESGLAMTGLINVHAMISASFIQQSGEQGVTVEPLRWQAPLPRIRVDWVKREPNEARGAYLQRVLGTRPEWGVARGRRQLGGLTITVQCHSNTSTSGRA